MDPWLDDGVFEGSWCHYPPLKTQHKDLQDVDAIYLSHIHPDHYDERYFDYPKNIPIYILKSRYNFLSKNLKHSGYMNVIELESGVPHRINGSTITIFSPFCSNIFHESRIGNLIDSAIVIKDDNGCIALNANDNTPDEKACNDLKKMFGSFDLAMINYNAAGAYPSCFINLSDDEKLGAHTEILKRNISHLIKCCDILEPKAVLPFAGAYVIGGNKFKKNKYLGTTTWDYCAEQIRDTSRHNAITLREGDIYDLQSKKSNKPYIPIDINAQNNYIENTLANLKYPYELDKPVPISVLDQKINTAKISLRSRVSKYHLKVRSKIKIVSDGSSWIINEGDPTYGVNLDFYLDGRLLNRILEKQSHWNNAEIGCHIEIDRRPNTYEIDAHTMMQFFHI